MVNIPSDNTVTGDEMYGLYGKVLMVDLTTNTIKDRDIPDKIAQKYIGGKGLGLKILLDWFPDYDYDAFSEKNPVIYMTGPFTDFGIPGSARHIVISKSPLTRFLAESYAGGEFGTHLKRTGYDGVIITGKAEVPKYLVITPEEIVLEEAEPLDLWGKYPSTVTDILIRKYGKLKVSSIGPAGERLVRFACIINDRNRANGRCGLGAVLGYKNLKAIGVRGSQHAELYDETSFKAVRKSYLKNIKSSSSMNTYGKYGTAFLVTNLNERGILPTKNFQSGQFDKAEDISGEKLYDTILTARDSCPSCPIRCKRVVQGKFKDKEILPIFGGPEYETIGAFGSLLTNKDLNSIALANQKCDQYGLDTISTGNVIAFVMEASERNLIEDKIPWGDPDIILELIEKINTREGLGKELGEGVKRFSESIGGEKYAVHVKGLETPLHEPRGKKGLGISYAVSPRGSTHLEGLHDTMIEAPDASPELGAVKSYNRFSLENKIQIVKNFEDVRSFTNSLIQCVFTVTLFGKNYNVNILRDLLYSVTGEKLDSEGMLARGALFYDLGRTFSCRHGCQKSDDDLPDRFKTEKLKFWGQKELISDKELKISLEEYYNLRGWDKKGRVVK